MGKIKKQPLARKACIALVLLTASLFSAACWDAKELSATAIVLGAGIDREQGRLRLTAELSTADSSEAAVLQSEGDSLEECLDALHQLIEEELFWGGTAAVIYGSGVDGKTADECGRFLYRTLGVSGKTPVFRAWNSSSGDVLCGSFGQAPYVAIGLGEALRLAKGGRALPTLIKQLEAFPDQAALELAATVSVDEEGTVSLVDIAK